MFSRTFQTIFFLKYIHHFCEFKPFLNFIFQLPVWSKYQLQYIIPNIIIENTYIVFLTWLFDYLIYKVIFYLLYFFFKWSKCKLQFLVKDLRKYLTLNGLHLVWPILDPKNTLSLLFITSKSLWLTVLIDLLFESMSDTKFQN